MANSRIYFRSSSFKMALLFTVLLSLAVLSLGYFLYDFGREGYERESEATIDAVISTILLEQRIDEGRHLEAIISERVEADDGVHYLLVDLQGQRLAGDLAGFPEDVDRIAEGVILFELSNTVDGNHLDLQVAAKIHTFLDGHQLLVAKDIDDIANRFSRLRFMSLMSIVCMLLVIIVSYLISVFVVSSINRMSDTALEIIETGDLTRRLTVDSRWDDLSHLSRVLNEMLGRIEGLMEGVKEVSDNIAHDLRTPLTHLRNRLEELESSGLPDSQVQSLIEEADHILQTFQSLLRISRMDAGRERSMFEEVELKTVLADVVELYHPIGESRSVELLVEADEAFSIWGDRNLLFQMFANLLDNALKYTSESSRVTIGWSMPTDGLVEVTLDDEGPGIPEAEKERVFDRFYRCDASRSSRGSGLGLSLVGAIVRLHRGRILLRNREPTGLRVVVQLPSGPPKITDS